MENTLLELRGISKRYPGVQALDDISLTIRTGEVHALLGENGAGKSTLIKTISGAEHPDFGTFVFEGTAYESMTPALSQKLGIGVIYQEFNLVPYLSAAENIFLGKKLSEGILFDRKTVNRESQSILDSLGVKIDARVLVNSLSVAYQQIVEIAKNISNNKKLLIMDEPTAPLTNHEIEAIFSLIAKLKARGVSIIYISHRLEEIFRIADRVTVMRDGRYIATLDTDSTDRNQLIELMVGRELSDHYPKSGGRIGKTVLEIKNLCTNGFLKDVSFSVREGEILGLAGLVGAGRTETVRAVFGADPVESGEILIDGSPERIKDPRDAIRHGIALIPEDRKKHGLLLRMSVRENISFIVIKKLSKLGIVSAKKDGKLSETYINQLKIKTPSMQQTVKNLSGGNQQKVVLAKSLAGSSRVLMFDEPTRGIDVGAKQEIYHLMRDLASKGLAIIMISSDMPELLGLSDRIVVMHEGRVAGEVSAGEATQNTIMQLASGEPKGELG